MATFRFQSLDIYRLAKEICVAVQDARIKDASFEIKQLGRRKAAF